MTLYLRPDADDLDGAWTNESGNNTNLYASLDETSASDSDYIQSPLNPVAETCRIALSNPTGGTPAEPFTLSYRFNNLGGTQLTVRLLQGTTEIASWPETGSGWTTSNRTLTGLQFAAISDFTNLFVELTATTGDTSLKLDLNFTAMAGTLDSRVTFTRASAATYFNSSGVLTSASSGAARFDYNPVNLAARGLLLEEQRTNNVPRSQEISDGAWAKGNWTVTANAIVAPDGTTTADKLVETTATASRYLFNGTPAFSGIGSKTLTASWYLKAAERTWCLCSVEGGGQTYGYYINIGAGTIGSAGGSAASDKVTITDVGGGWYRVTITKTVTLSATDGYATIYGALADGGGTYTGTAGSGFYVWGVQLEEGSFATSHIPTTTAAVTRAADSANITGTNFSSWYNATEGTFVIELATAATGHQFFWNVNDSIDPNNKRMAIYDSNNNTVKGFVANTTAYFDNLMGGFTAHVPFKAALAVKNNDVAGCVNGGVVASTATATIPTTVNNFGLANNQIASGPAPGWYARLTYYNVRKTNAELQELTGPSLDLDFTAGVLDSRVTFARASAATRVDATGLIATVASGAPRFDHDPATLAARGLLLEEQRTNLILQSNTFTVAPWNVLGTGSGSTGRTANAGTAPDGTNTATRMDVVRSSSTDTAAFQQTFSGTSTSPHTVSIWVKAFDGSNVGKTITLTSTDLATQGAVSTVTLTSAWQRVSFSRGLGASSGEIMFGHLSSGIAGAAADTGLTVFLAWGAQAELGSFATSPITTTTAAVSRAADSASMTGTNFSSWYNQTEGTFVMAADYRESGDGFAHSLLVSDGGNINESLGLQKWGGLQEMVGRIVDNAADQMISYAGIYTQGTSYKVALAYKGNDAAVCLNGAAAVPDTSVTVPTPNMAQILGGSGPLSGHVQRLTYYPTRKSNAQLQALTT